MTFQPYPPPNESDGPLTIDKDLCWRINEAGHVTPAVIGAICWAQTHLSMTEVQQEAILVGLGLEIYRRPDNSTVLQPKDAYRIPLQPSNPDIAPESMASLPCEAASNEDEVQTSGGTLHRLVQFIPPTITATTDRKLFLLPSRPLIRSPCPVIPPRWKA